MTLSSDPILPTVYEIEQRILRNLTRLTQNAARGQTTGALENLQAIMQDIANYGHSVSDRDTYRDYRPNEVNLGKRFAEKASDAKRKLRKAIEKATLHQQFGLVTELFRSMIDQSFELGDRFGSEDQNGRTIARSLLQKPFEDFRQQLSAHAEQGNVRGIIALYQTHAPDVFSDYGFDMKDLNNCALKAAFKAARFETVKALIVNIGADPSIITDAEIEEVAQRPGGMKTAVYVGTVRHTRNWVPGQTETQITAGL